MSHDRVPERNMDPPERGFSARTVEVQMLIDDASLLITCSAGSDECEILKVVVDDDAGIARDVNAIKEKIESTPSLTAAVWDKAIEALSEEEPDYGDE